MIELREQHPDMHHDDDAAAAATAAAAAAAATATTSSPPPPTTVPAARSANNNAAAVAVAAAPTPPAHRRDAAAAVAAAKWRRFADWLHCVCVVTFDLELGQAMELVYPAHARLSEAERTNVCYLAFPDSNSGCMGDTQFHVRLRVQPERPAEARLGAAQRRYNGRCEARLRADAGHLWGFVFFRQIRDARRPRGYFQKVRGWWWWWGGDLFWYGINTKIIDCGDFREET